MAHSHDEEAPELHGSSWSCCDRRRAKASSSSSSSSESFVSSSKVSPWSGGQWANGKCCCQGRGGCTKTSCIATTPGTAGVVTGKTRQFWGLKLIEAPSVFLQTLFVATSYLQHHSWKIKIFLKKLVWLSPFIQLGLQWRSLQMSWANQPFKQWHQRKTNCVEDLLGVAFGSADLESFVLPLVWSSQRLPNHTPKLLGCTLCSGDCLLEDLEPLDDERTCIYVLKRHRHAKSHVHLLHLRPIVLDTLFILGKSRKYC